MSPQLAGHPAIRPAGHSSPLSDILDVQGFLTPPQTPINEAQNAPSASPLSASVPELRFRTRVWWTYRDARWAQADIQSPLQTGTNPVNEQSKENLKKNRLVVIAKQPRESQSFLVPNWVLTCAPDRPADDVLYKPVRCSQYTIVAFSGCACRYQCPHATQLPQKKL